MLKKLLDENLLERNEFYDAYIDLIAQNKNQKRIKYKTEQHHIIPRCYFKRHPQKLPVDNSKENLINLLHKNHLLAHYYLAKCATGWLKFYLIQAFTQLQQRLNKNISCDIFNIMDDYQVLIEEGLKLKSTLYKGRKQSEESKIKRIATRLERYPDGVRTNTGKKRLIKDGIRIFVLRDQVEKYLKDGWKFDRQPRSEETKQKIREAKRVNKKVAWNKGLTKEIDARVAKNAESTSRSIQRIKTENPDLWKKHTDNIGKRKRNCVVVTNGIEDRMIKLDLLDEFLANGYVRGRTFKKTPEQNRKSAEKRKGLKPGNFGKICIYNTTTGHRTYIFEEELPKYINLGYHKGKK